MRALVEVGAGGEPGRARGRRRRGRGGSAAPGSPPGSARAGAILARQVVSLDAVHLAQALRDGHDQHGPPVDDDLLGRGSSNLGVHSSAAV